MQGARPLADSRATLPEVGKLVLVQVHVGALEVALPSRRDAGVVDALIMLRPA